MKVLVVGDSHTGPMQRGLVALGKSGGLDPAIEITVSQLGAGQFLATPFWRAEADHADIIEPTYRNRIARLPPDNTVDAIVLCMPLWPMRVVRRVVLGDNCLVDPLPGRQPISAALFRRAVLQDQRHVLELFDHLKSIGVAAIAVSGPGLFRDHFVLRRMEPHAVLMLFNAYRQVIMTELDSRGVSVIDIPQECLDDEGFMRVEYRHPSPDDEHHANAAFGKLMVLGIQRCFLDPSRG